MSQDRLKEGFNFYQSFIHIDGEVAKRIDRLLIDEKAFLEEISSRNENYEIFRVMTENFVFSNRSDQVTLAKRMLSVPGAFWSLATDRVLRATNDGFPEVIANAIEFETGQGIGNALKILNKLPEKTRNMPGIVDQIPNFTRDYDLGLDAPRGWYGPSMIKLIEMFEPNNMRKIMLEIQGQDKMHMLIMRTDTSGGRVFSYPREVTFPPLEQFLLANFSHDDIFEMLDGKGGMPIVTALEINSTLDKIVNNRVQIGFDLC